MHNSTKFTPAPNIAFLPFNDTGVLFATGTRKIWVLNTTAAIAWCLLEEGENFGQILNFFSKNFRANTLTHETDINTIINNFETEGLLGPGLIVDRKPETLDIKARETTLDNKNIQFVWQKTFELPEILFRVSAVSLSLGREIEKSLVNIISKDKDSQPAATISILPNENQKNKFDIYTNHELYHSALPFKSTLPVLMNLIYMISSRRIKDKLLFHAAAICKDKQVVIMPGDSGKGKTTMTAALLTKGFRYLSDEIALINPNTSKVYPFPLPLSIKSGSLPILKKYYPDISDYQIFQRLDKKQVRYYPIAEKNIIPLHQGYPLKGIIFMNFDKNAKTALAELDNLNALKLLVKTCSSNRPLGVQDVEGLLKLITRTQCHSFTFSEIEESTKLLEHI